MQSCRKCPMLWNCGPFFLCFNKSYIGSSAFPNTWHSLTINKSKSWLSEPSHYLKSSEHYQLISSIPTTPIWRSFWRKQERNDTHKRFITKLSFLIGKWQSPECNGYNRIKIIPELVLVHQKLVKKFPLELWGSPAIYTHIIESI